MLTFSMQYIVFISPGRQCLDVVHELQYEHIAGLLTLLYTVRTPDMFIGVDLVNDFESCYGLCFSFRQH